MPICPGINHVSMPLRGNLWWGNCGPGRFLLSWAGGRAKRILQPLSSHSSSLWRLERPPGTVGVGGLTPAQDSSDFHYVWQRPGLCALGGSGLRARRGQAGSWPGWGGPLLLLFLSLSLSASQRNRAVPLPRGLPSFRSPPPPPSLPLSRSPCCSPSPGLSIEIQAMAAV